MTVNRKSTLLGGHWSLQSLSQWVQDSSWGRHLEPRTGADQLGIRVLRIPCIIFFPSLVLPSGMQILLHSLACRVTVFSCQNQMQDQRLEPSLLTQYAGSLLGLWKLELLVKSTIYSISSSIRKHEPLPVENTTEDKKMDKKLFLSSEFIIWCER